MKEQILGKKMYGIQCFNFLDIYHTLIADIWNIFI